MGGAVGVGTGVDEAGEGGVGVGVDSAGEESIGVGVGVAGGGGIGAGVDIAGGGDADAGASVAAGVTGAVVDCGDATGPQAAVSRARTVIRSANAGDPDKVPIVNTCLRKYNHRVRSAG